MSLPNPLDVNPVTQSSVDAHQPPLMEMEEAQAGDPPSKTQTIAVISCITCIVGSGNLLAGLLTVCIPVIARDLNIPPALQLWPASGYALACGCTLLLCAAAADLLGCRRVCLLGTLVQACSAVGAGLATTTTQLIALRSLGGIAASLCLPSAVSIVARSFPADKRPRSRRAAFSAMGGGQAVGFGLGLALGGVFSDTIGWRWGFFATAILNTFMLGLGLWSLPTAGDPKLVQLTLSSIRKQLDWVGAMTLSISLALLSYELAIFAAPDSRQNLTKPLNIILLVIALALFPLFGMWMRRQTRRGRPALIPNRLWMNLPFSTVCAVVFLVWGALNASEQLTALYLQDVRGFSALTTSLYFLPAPICGALMNVAIAVLLPRLRPAVAVPVGCLISGAAPVLLAVLCRVDGPSYWGAVFQAMAINPMGADLMYTIANLVITDAFPAKTQAVAGGVFNMLSQIGKSVGIATTTIIAQQITASTHLVGSKEALLRGYKAGWWYNSGLGFASVIVSLWGLRNVKKLGIKME